MAAGADNLEWARAHLDAYLADLEAFVGIESPSLDKAACDRAGRYLADRLRDACGARVTMHPRDDWGDHVAAEVGDGARKVVLLVHFDTVWPIGTLKRLPFEIEGDLLHGPGVFDMKGGALMAVWALHRLVDQGALGDHRFVVLATSDEETGSLSSRGLIETTARDADAVLVFEPAYGPDGAAVTWRRGVGMFDLEVEGLAAHAGREPEKGRSAVVELAHQVLDLHRLNDPAAGNSVNVGIVEGGTRLNVVPAAARAQIDLRVRDDAGMRAVVERILDRPTFLEGTRVRCTGSINRPPMAETDAGLRLFEKAREAARREGVELIATGSGGASDGNFTAGLGVTTLDGMGVTGGGAHADHEHLVVSALAGRLAWLPRFLASI